MVRCTGKAGLPPPVFWRGQAETHRPGLPGRCQLFM